MLESSKVPAAAPYRAYEIRIWRQAGRQSGRC